MKPLLINNLEFVKNQEIISGELLIESCDRLIDLNSKNSDSPQILYKLTGVLTKHHLPSLHLMIDASLTVICQRCLDNMPLKLSLDYDYVICESEPAPFEGDEDVDWLEVSREMNVNQLIEDELLMAIPLAPTHQHDCKVLNQERGEKLSPFAALKDLIK